VARETGVAQALTGSQSSGNGGLRVRAEKAGFDALVAFLGALSTQYGVSIENASIESVGTAGIVNATLVLR
jgi:type II secretory pathway component PulM